MTGASTSNPFTIHSKALISHAYTQVALKLHLAKVHVAKGDGSIM